MPEAAHIALVNQESSASADPGPCVELARSRRIEWVAYRQAKLPAQAVCVQPCDTDPNDPGKAQNSAAYIELGGAAATPIPVAIVDDTDPYIEGLRADIRPEGPELDGIIGAGVLSRSRVEVDYRSSGMRAIFSCDGETNRQICWTGARCPRLPDQSTQHACFNLPLAGLPAMCADDMCGGLDQHAGGGVTVPHAGGRAAAGDGPDAVAAPAGPRAAAAVAPAPAKVRVAIPDFQVEGSSSPALALQLQDGFVLGLVRAGVQVVDPVDAGRKLESKPELARCDSSPCLKSIGQLLDVRYLVRVKVEVAGNSYKVGRAHLLDRGGGARRAAAGQQIEELRRVHGRRGARRDAAPGRRAQELPRRGAHRRSAGRSRGAAPSPAPPGRAGDGGDDGRRGDGGRRRGAGHAGQL